MSNDTTAPQITQAIRSLIEWAYDQGARFGDEITAEVWFYEAEEAGSISKRLPDIAALARAPLPAQENEKLRELLHEADKLLWIASGAMLKMGLRDKGSDCGLPHEVREFALEFSNEGRDGPGALQVRGTGRYRTWLIAVRNLDRAAMSRTQENATLAASLAGKDKQ